MIYQWKNKGFFGTDAQIAGEICETLTNTVGLSADTLLQASEPEDAPLHNEFEWDNDIAADNYRHIQAGNIIRNLEIVCKEQEPTRAFMTIERRVAHNSSYEPTVEILSDEDKRDKLLEQALMELEWFKRKYDGIKALAAVFEAIDAVEANRGGERR